MIVDHPLKSSGALPGVPSSKYRGVFKRDGQWEVALCLHPTGYFRNSGVRSLYRVVGVIDNERQAALAHDHFINTSWTNLQTWTWNHLKGLRMNPDEQKIYRQEPAQMVLRCPS